MILEKLQERFGETSIFKLGDGINIDIQRLPSGSIGLDYILGGGWALGKLNHIYAKESGGKTTLAKTAIAEAQKLGKTVAFIDMEHAFDSVYARALGVNTKDLILSQPDNGEMALEMIYEIAKLGGVDLVVLDSITSCISKAELEEDTGHNRIGLHAKLMSQGLKKIKPTLSLHKTTVLAVNQTRVDVGGYINADNNKPTGGSATKFYPEITVKLTGSKDRDRNGIKVTAKTEKNKTAAPFQVCDFEIGTKHLGIIKTYEILDWGVELGFLERGGAYYKYEGSSIGQGKDKASDFLLDNVELMDSLELKIREELNIVHK